MLMFSVHCLYAGLSCYSKYFLHNKSDGKLMEY
jgi:hypothetical protein